MIRTFTCLWILAFSFLALHGASGQDPIDVLFLGDGGHHQPLARFKQLRPGFEARGIRLTYTDDVNQLSAETLQHYQALMLYANIDNIQPEQADALLAYVQNGGGFVPLHCASFCFRNDDRVVALIGGQFLRHGTGVFRTQIEVPDHPVMAGFQGFESWDETYVHHLHATDGRLVLETRVDNEGAEPWTWVKEFGEGRVFYTAWGHDERTWKQPGFENLVERGVRWVVKQDPQIAGPFSEDAPFPVPQITEQRTDVAPFEFEDVGSEIPNYTPGNQWGAQGENLSLMQRPLPPEESIKHFVVPQGFRLELFASEPDLGGKPICMTWDDRGRLWVAETLDYPNELQPEGKGRDRIRICEDTDGDGKADRFVVFAEGLSIPTSIAFASGSVIVHDATRTLRFTDTDGDDVADQREVMFTGWSAGDTHGGVSNFQYGLDNWIWGMQGYNQSEPVVDGRPVQGFRQGFFRFRPDGSALEFMRSTDNNTWGLGISEEGIIFGSTANHNPSVYLPIPNRYYESVRGWGPSVLGTIADTWKFKASTDKIRQVDQFGGYTAAAGHALYTARTYPREYWNRVAFVTEPTGHLIGTFVLSRDGANFRSTSPFNLVASDDEWSAPTMAEVGPDGNVWVIDWYNYIVQHNPTPRGFETGRGNAYETELRDKRHGRIYRLVYDAGTPSPAADLTTSAGRLAALSNPNFLWRRHAQRLLVESGDRSVVSELVDHLKTPQLDETGLDVRAIHSLWTLQGLGVVTPDQSDVWASVAGALSHPSAGVRRNACQVIAGFSESSAAIVAAASLGDRDAQVRMAALLALADSPASVEVGEAIVSALSNPNNAVDAWLPDAAIAAGAKHDAQFLAALSSVKEISPALLRAVSIVAEHHARGDDRSGSEKVFVAIPKMPAELSQAVIDGLSKGWPATQELVLSDSTQETLLSGLQQMPLSSRGQLIKLMTRLGSDRFEEFGQAIANELLEGINDADRDLNDRVNMVTELVSFRSGDLQTVDALLELITPQTEPELAEGILNALREATVPEAGASIRSRLPLLAPAARKAAIATMLRRSEWSVEMLNAIEAREMGLSELTLEQQRALGSHPNRTIADRAQAILMSGGTLPSADRKLVIEDYLEAAKLEGDVTRGEELFKAQCANCHTYRDLGNRVGPDLTGMAFHPKEELLVHILDPNASVEGNFRVYTVSTFDGLILNGLMASETRTSIELFDSQGKRQTLLREDIEDLVASPLSLMPVGFEKQLNVPQMSDLLSYLTQRGKYVPLDLAKVATITSARGMFIDEDNDIERLIFDQWGVVQHQEIPFVVIDPQGGEVANTILLRGPEGEVCRRMPTSVKVPCDGPVARLHLLSGVSGWGSPFGEQGTVSMVVRFHYADGETEDHELLNGVHFADYIRRVDVPESEFAFMLRGQQIRYLALSPKRRDPMVAVEFVKGTDRSAPVVMAVTVETE